MVIQTFSGSLLFAVNDKVYELEEIPTHEQKSKNFDIVATSEKPRKRNIPSMKHPWRRDSFLKYRCNVNVYQDWSA